MRPRRPGRSGARPSRRPGRRLVRPGTVRPDSGGRPVRRRAVPPGTPAPSAASSSRPAADEVADGPCRCSAVAGSSRPAVAVRRQTGQPGQRGGVAAAERRASRPAGRPAPRSGACGRRRTAAPRLLLMSDPPGAHRHASGSGVNRTSRRSATTVAAGRSQRVSAAGSRNTRRRASRPPGRSRRPATAAAGTPPARAAATGSRRPPPARPRRGAPRWQGPPRRPSADRASPDGCSRAAVLLGMPDGRGRLRQRPGGEQVGPQGQQLRRRHCRVGVRRRRSPPARPGARPGPGAAGPGHRAARRRPVSHVEDDDVPAVGLELACPPRPRSASGGRAAPSPRLRPRTGAAPGARRRGRSRPPPPRAARDGLAAPDAVPVTPAQAAQAARLARVGRPDHDRLAARSFHHPPGPRPGGAAGQVEDDRCATAQRSTRFLRSFRAASVMTFSALRRSSPGMLMVTSTSSR